MRYTVRPISDRTAFTGKHERSSFTSSWSDTLSILDRELKRLAARDVVFEVDVTEGAIRLDGMLYANAKVASPAVRIAFESKHGPLTYATDRFVPGYRSLMTPWQHNVRAIALGLEALRKVNRYSITKRGEQYAGFKALPAGRSMPASHMTRSEAAEILERIAIGDEGETRQNTVLRILADASYAREVWKHARAATHPDRRAGDRTGWDQVEQAAAVLGVTS